MKSLTNKHKQTKEKILNEIAVENDNFLNDWYYYENIDHNVYLKESLVLVPSNTKVINDTNYNKLNLLKSLLDKEEVLAIPTNEVEQLNLLNLTEDYSKSKLSQYRYFYNQYSRLILISIVILVYLTVGCILIILK